MKFLFQIAILLPILFVAVSCSSSSPCVFSQVGAAMEITPTVEQDANFGQNGALLSGTGVKSGAYRLALTPDGNIIAAGIAYHSVTLAHYAVNGSPILSFGDKGLGVVPFDFTPTAIAFQSDGKLLVGGTQLVAGSGSMISYRVNLDGTRDETFGTAGSVTSPFGPSSAFELAAIAVQRNDSFTMVGTASTTYSVPLSLLPFPVPVTTVTELAFFRGQKNGAPDSNFGNQGQFNLTGLSAVALLSSVTSALQTDDGSLYVAGDSYDTDGQQLTVVHINSNGALDLFFGTLDRARATFGIGHSQALGIAKDANGNLVVSGRVLEQNKYDAVVTRFLPNGQLDASFGNKGELRAHDDDGFDLSADTVLLDNSQRILAAGFRRGPVAAQSIDSDICIALPTKVRHTTYEIYRYEPGGAVDATFGTNGRLSLGFGATFSWAHTLLLYPASLTAESGRVLVAGETDGGFSLTRLLP